MNTTTQGYGRNGAATNQCADLTSTGCRDAKAQNFVKKTAGTGVKLGKTSATDFSCLTLTDTDVKTKCKESTKNIVTAHTTVYGTASTSD